MRPSIIYIFILTVFFNSVNGQTRISIDRPRSGDTTNSPLVLVDTFKTDLKYLVISPLKIDSISIFKDSMAIQRFGSEGKSGVIIIHAKQTANMLRLDKILENSELQNADRKLRVCINKTLVKTPELVLIDKSDIESIEVTTDRHWINIEDANSGEKFINIITRTKDKNGL